MTPTDRKSPKAAIIIGIGHPAGAAGRGDSQQPKPPRLSSPEEPDADDGGEGDKETPKDAMVINADLAAAMGLSPNPVCGHCSMFTGNACTKVQGNFEPDDRCLRYWEPADKEPDADDMGSGGGGYGGQQQGGAPQRGNGGSGSGYSNYGNAGY